MQECPIDASIKPGNSGGPVYRLSDGKVIGLAGWKMTTEQVENLAISIDGLKALPGQGNPATTVPVPVPAPAP
jgi:S1-C subfamily serine protease